MGSLFLDSTPLGPSASVPVSAPPISWAAWTRFATDGPNFPAIMAITTDAGDNNGFELTYGVQQFNKRVEASVWRGSSPQFSAVSTNAEGSNAVWVLCTGVYAGDADRRAYFNAGNKGTNVTSYVPQFTPTTFLIGASANGGAANTRFMKAHLGYGFVWNGTLSDADVADLYAGTIPQPGNLVAVYDGTVNPGAGSIIDQTGNGFNLPNSGATYDGGQTPPVTYNFGTPVGRMRSRPMLRV